MYSRILLPLTSAILLLAPTAATDVGIFAWGSTIRATGIQQFTNDVLNSGYSEVAVLIRGVSTPTRIDTLSAVYSSIKAKDPNVKVYAWIAGFERKHGWDKPWDPRVREDILNAVRLALPYCDGIVLDDSFRYPTSDPVKRAKAMQAITDLVREISELTHSHGKKLYFCLLPERPTQYSLDRDAIAKYVDKFIVEAYTMDYGRGDEWPVRIYELYERLYPGKIAIALHEPNENRLVHQLTLLAQAGCPEIWIFRYGEVKWKDRVKEVVRSITGLGGGGAPLPTETGQNRGGIDLTGLLLTGLTIGTLGGLALAMVHPETVHALADSLGATIEKIAASIQKALETVTEAITGFGSANVNLGPLTRMAVVFGWGLLMATLLGLL